MVIGVRAIDEAPHPHGTPTPRYDRRSPSSGAFSYTTVVAKGPEWRTNSAASSIRFPDWCGLRIRLGRWISSIDIGAHGWRL
jgi:hypothetical protein